jgi:hypothetical protein
MVAIGKDGEGHHNVWMSKLTARRGNILEEGGVGGVRGVSLTNAYQKEEGKEEKRDKRGSGGDLGIRWP